MGIYLNPDNENFKMTLKAPIYVDKTMMLDVLNGFIETGNKYICVSRPRRFGKTIAGNMISAYYSKGCDSINLFEGLKINSVETSDKYMNRFNVIQIDMNSEYQNARDKTQMLSGMSRWINRELNQRFPDTGIDIEDSIANNLLKVYAKTKETFVIIIDEYDVLVREKVEKKLFDEYMSFLNGLFKSNTLRPAISLAYLTGILPIVRDKVQSKLNNFEEYTILDAGELAEYVGFTDEEVRKLCEHYGVDYDECRLWYDGYRQHGFEIYNPESVVQCVKAKKFSGYWGRTSSYEVISDQLVRNFDGVKDAVIGMLSGEEAGVNIGRYINTMTDFHTASDIFTYLMYVGYLAYNSENETCSIPNKEIRQEWFNALETIPEYKVTDGIIKASRELLEETLKGNEEAVAKALDVSHIHVTSNRSYNNEDALASAIYLAYIYALNEYNVYKELTTGKGFADVVFIPFSDTKPAMIIELKHNKSADSALKQIRQKKYSERLMHYSGDMLFVGISYDESTKEHSCMIEKIRK